MSLNRSRLAFFFVLQFLAATLWASDAPWTIDDILNQESLGNVVLSADGRQAAFTVATWEGEKGDKAGADEEGEKKRTQKIYLVELGADASSLGEAKPRTLTHGGEGIGDLAFSPDGRSLAFLSDRDVPAGKAKGPQLWLLPLSGGEARALTKFPRGVQSFDWIDNNALLVARDESADGLERRRKELGDTAVAVDDPRQVPPVRLWRVPLEGQPERLTRNDDWIAEFDVDPEGRRAVVSAGTSLSFEFDSKSPSAAWIVDLATGERSGLDVAGSRAASGFRWSPDGQSIWFREQHSSHPLYRTATISRPLRWDAATGTSTRIDAGWTRGLGSGPLPIPGGALAGFHDGVFSRPAFLPDGGSHRALDPGTTARDLRFVHEILEVSSDGRTALLEVSASDLPTQLYAARLDASRTRLLALRQLTELNAAFEKRAMPRVEVLRFAGAESTEVEGLLHFPIGWQEGDAPAPLVLSPHGGPAGHDRHAWDQRISYPNLHGSSAAPSCWR